MAVTAGSTLKVNPFSLGPTSDARIWHPQTSDFYVQKQTHNIGIQTRRKELTNAFILILNWQNTFGYIKVLERLKG